MSLETPFGRADFLIPYYSKESLQRRRRELQALLACGDLNLSANRTDMQERPLEDSLSYGISNDHPGACVLFDAAFGVSKFNCQWCISETGFRSHRVVCTRRRMVETSRVKFCLLGKATSPTHTSTQFWDSSSREAGKLTLKNSTCSCKR